MFDRKEVLTHPSVEHIDHVDLDGSTGNNHGRTVE